MTQAKPSKTAAKREQLELQKLGERLIGLDPALLHELPLDDRLRDAVIAASTVKGRGALRRQKQLIGKLMRSADSQAISDALDKQSADDRLLKRVFGSAERWRDRIVENGTTAIDEFSAISADAGDELRKLNSELNSSRNERVSKAKRRQIFRVVHDALLSCARSDRISR